MNNGKDVLDALKAHPILHGAVPDRVRLGYREAASMSTAERYAAGIEALKSLPSWPQVSEFVTTLAHLRWEPAVPTLKKLWERCPITPVLSAVGEALFKIGTPDAHAALQSTLEEAGHNFVVMGIYSIFACERKNAFGSLDKYFTDEGLATPTGMAITRECLRLLSPNIWDGGKWIWPSDSIPLFLQEDRRWVSLAVRLRHHKEYKHYARSMLRGFSNEEVEAALLEYDKPPVAAISKPYAGRRDFLTRYQSGEYESVWRDLRALGSILDEGLRAEATEVALATMERVRFNVECIIARLHARGYPFDEFMLPHLLPTETTAEGIRQIEAAAHGHIPISLMAFWSVVGGVSLMHKQQWDEEDENTFLRNADPLVVEPPLAVLSQVADWQSNQKQYHPEAVGPLFLDLAPDHYHKANISGGSPYGIEVPNEGVDAIWENEEHELPFVEYLRLCFRWGGFPRLPLLSKPILPEMQTILNDFKRDIVPF